MTHAITLPAVSIMQGEKHRAWAEQSQPRDTYTALCVHMQVTVSCLHASPRLTHCNEAPVSSRISSQPRQEEEEEGGRARLQHLMIQRTHKEKMPPQQN